MPSPSKARTLELLASAADVPFVVDPFVVFAVADWNHDLNGVLKRIHFSAIGPVVVVRSSAVAEDVDLTIPPGIFQSTLGVQASDETSLREAVERVIRSYNKHRETQNHIEANEIVVQKQLIATRLSGIAHASGDSGYFHVDYDDESGRTDTVTAGLRCKSAEIVLDKSWSLPDPWAAIRNAVVAVQEITTIDNVVVEFAVSDSGVVHVFQARQNAGPRLALPLGRRAVDSLRLAHAGLASGASSWSDMADWNPAELLGSRPQPLALSLYQYLITDKAWLDGRRSLGYRDVQPSRLVEAIVGKPYVNLRSSFLSLTPAGLQQGIAEALVDDRLTFLRSQPSLHDKVETEILFTAADVQVPPRTQSLRSRGFSAAVVAEIEGQLRTLTNSLVNSQRRWATADLDLQSRLQVDHGGARDEPYILARSIVADINRCRDAGVVPFARHARLAFVGRDLLARLIARGAISPEWETQWWAGISTVVQDVVQAIRAATSGGITRTQFDHSVGHLRARTFDIHSPRYDSLDTLPQLVPTGQATLTRASVSGSMTRAVDIALQEASLSIESHEFFHFVEQSTQLRESLKFSFTRVLSDVLEDLARLGEQLGLSRDDMAYCTFAEIEAVAGQEVPKEESAARLRDAIMARREDWTECSRVVLPNLIFESADLLVVKSLPGQPNFVTSKVSEGDVAVVQGAWETSAVSLDAKIVLIEAADPGFDWIFAFRLAGLVTKYGGATSHMAIRCAQMQVPAAIGCGDVLFARILEAKRIRLNCGTKEIVALSTDVVAGGAGSARSNHG